MVGLDELAHLMVASLQRSWCNRVSPYGGHELRVLLLDCAVHCVTVSHLASHVLVTFLVAGHLLSSYRFPITAGLQINQHAQELSGASVDASEAPIATEEPPSPEQEPKRIECERVLRECQPVPTGMAVALPTAPGACTTSSLIRNATKPAANPSS